MTDFNDLRAGLTGARQARDVAAQQVFLAREELRRLGRAKHNLRRTVEVGSAAWDDLVAQEAIVAGRLEELTAVHADALQVHLGLFEAFRDFTDPREHLGRLDDDVPILLLPVRIEARFKELAAGDGVVHHELWVRIFPDDSAVESFDEALTEAEIGRARDFLIAWWKGGEPANADLEDVVDQARRGAWRTLMGGFNAGRAHWIRETYLPITDEEGVPTRTSADETILVIAGTTLPTAAERAALRTFWTAMWSAVGDPDAADAALPALAATLGLPLPEAAALADAHQPHDLADELGRAAPDGPVTVGFVRFPAPEDVPTKLDEWSRAAAVNVLPERFVLLAYQGNHSPPVIQEPGNVIPDSLTVGPPPGSDIDDVLAAEFADFDTLDDDEKAERYITHLSERAETRWLFDFDEAIANGMGFRIEISPEQYRTGFSRLFVLGVRVGEDERAGQASMERLIRDHHLGETGFEILPQGIPTNTTAGHKSGFSVEEDSDEAFDRYGSPPGDGPDAATDKWDGRWLAELLGVDADAATLGLVRGFDGTDRREAVAMNTALFNATLGHFMESMLTPVFDDRARGLVRSLMINHVSGRGPIPAVRIGDQPYGILPTTTISRMEWLTRDETSERVGALSDLRRLHDVLVAIRAGWSGLIDDVAHIGKPDSDPHEILLQALGLHATSVGFDQRHLRSFEHFYNYLMLYGLMHGPYVDVFDANSRQRGLSLLRTLGYVHTGDVPIPLLEKLFLSTVGEVNRPLIDTPALSESEPIRPSTEADQNYIEWLVENARTNHENIRGQVGFSGDRPTALLYDYLRHSVNIAFANTALNLYEAAGVLDQQQVAALRVDAPFIGVQGSSGLIESKWDLIYTTVPQVAPGGGLVVDHISELLNAGPSTGTRDLHETIAAVERLQRVPTARLERAMVEHLDCCSYRLDAWLLGLVNLQLHAMRFGAGDGQGEPDGEGGPRRGLHLGAYGWLEDVKREPRTLTPVELDDDLASVFDPAGDGGIMVDDTNAGYVHAPSTDHALTAAVLRNAYLSNADPDEARPFQVNLSSERVRAALTMVEGIQQGQSLAALLGYQLERGLHDNTTLKLDEYIYELRKVFPLSSNRQRSTKIAPGRVGGTPAEAARIAEEDAEFDEDEATTKVEARNVVHGLRLLERASRPGDERYPFGFPIGTGPGRLKFAPEPVVTAIDAEVTRLRAVRDAVADVAMAESVHQVVQGNYDRAAGVLDAFSKGGHPQLPDVVRSPASGVTVTHRVGIHLPPGAPPALDDPPRVTAARSVAAWVADLLPTDLTTVACRVVLRRPDYDGTGPGAPDPHDVTMGQLGLHPIDLLYLLGGEADKSLTALDDYVLRFVHETIGPRPDSDLDIQYTHLYDPLSGTVSFFEVMTLIGAARRLLTASRPLTAADIKLPGDAAQEQQPAPVLREGPVRAARIDVDDVLTRLNNEVVVPLAGLIDPEDFEASVNNAAAIVPLLDDLVGEFTASMFELSRYGIADAGFGWVIDRVTSIHEAAYRAVVNHLARWQDKLEEFDRLINVELAGAADDEEGVEILAEAERTISTSSTLPRPGTVLAYRPDVDAKKADVDVKRGQLVDFVNGDVSTLAGLRAATQLLEQNLDAFDFEVPALDDVRSMVVLAEDMLRQAEATIDAVGARTGAAQVLLDEADTSTDPTVSVDKVRDAAALIFGESFLLVPEFTLGAEQAAELQQCRDDVPQLLDHQRNVLGVELPVDEWLYGVARVRDKLATWESLAVLAEAVRDRSPLDLVPMQLPYRPDDHWVGLAYPEGFEIGDDTLVYTAYWPDFVAADAQRGLLIDEWTEVIPSRRETTGLTFHYDRPDSEPPQSMLLVTPSAFRGSWEWDDLVQTLHDTLELARLRAIEPDLIDRTGFAQFLPATISAVTTRPVTMGLNYVMLAAQDGGD